MLKLSDAEKILLYLSFYLKIVLPCLDYLLHWQELIEKINEVLTLHMGPEYILVNIRISFKNHLPVGNIEKAIEIITKNIKEEFPMIKKVFIEAESAK